MTTAPLNPHAAPFLPAITSLPTLPDASLASTLDLLFEPSPELRALALPTVRAMSFASYADLVATVRDELLAVAAAVRDDRGARASLHAALGGHPRLGGGGGGGGISGGEQRGLAGAGDELAVLNGEYEERFPGMRYVVFVNGRGRDAIVGDMRRRIDRGDLAAEEVEAIQVCGPPRDARDRGVWVGRIVADRLGCIIFSRLSVTLRSTGLPSCKRLFRHRRKPRKRYIPRGPPHPRSCQRHLPAARTHSRLSTTAHSFREGWQMAQSLLALPSASR